MLMVNLQELWIGDQLRVLDTGQIGHFEGLAGAKAKLRIAAKLVLIDPANLELAPELTPETEVEIEEESSPLNFHNLATTIDLHIEKLAPEMKNTNPVAILSYQLRRLAQYIDRVEEVGLKYVTIIHGKGTGVLKKEVEHMLKGRPSVKFLLDINEGGALEVHLY